MTDIEAVYSFLKTTGLVQNTDDFSTRFLRKSPSYYRMSRATKHFSLTALASLSSRLHQTASALKESDLGNATGLADDLSAMSDQLWHQVYSGSLDGLKARS